MYVHHCLSRYPAKIQISTASTATTQYDQSLSFAPEETFGPLGTNRAPIKDLDQPALLRRLI